MRSRIDLEIATLGDPRFWPDLKGGDAWMRPI
jgi:hypothetical protein